ncbi:MAG: hydrolase [Solirubrobacterales bacterium]|nr:hydrolase [Solirubrobacterales bacterium]
MEFRFCPFCAAALRPLPAGHRDAGRPACPQGHFVHYDNPAVTTYAFLAGADGRYLALRRAHPPCAGEWDLPGGFVEGGEDPSAAIAREVREETGLEIDVLGVIGAYTSVYGETGRHTVDVGFHARLAAGQHPGDMLLSDEKSEAAWFALDNFPDPAFAGERAGLADLKASRPPWTSPSPTNSS